ncbi:dihydroneopterin aldolase [Aquabacterium sp.]|jgi:dihydroneopterin aldolase|uniref:dihydroneopterin aldolase n=1 Tax=Aquabacterium sp. TaxID=1872578 RepID=UPI0025BBDB96|nr:dihydroneopterin aldolase [Aquabacterium sp.]
MSSADVLQMPSREHREPRVPAEAASQPKPHRQRRHPDRIVIRRLPMEARIGVYDWEQTAPQPVLVDLEFTLPEGPAAQTDALADTIDYAAVVARLKALALEQPRQLVEAMAHGMADALIAEFKLSWLRLGLTKLAPFPGAEVGIVIERQG